MILPNHTTTRNSETSVENSDDQTQISESTPEASSKPDSPCRQKLRSWLNKNLKIEMTDGRVLVGVFLCTDRDANVILGSCSEYLQPDEGGGAIEEPRVLGLVMVPGRHIVSIHLDDMTAQQAAGQDDEQQAGSWPESEKES